MSEPQDELFVQRRLLIASVLSALALTVYVYVSGPRAPVQPPEAQQEAQQVEPAAPPETAPPAAPPETAPPSEPSGQEALPESKASEAEQEIVIETDTSIVSFSNRGAVVTSWVLKNYHDAEGERLDLVHPKGAEKNGFPFGLASPGGEPLDHLNKALFAVTRDPEGGSLSVTFEYAGENWRARKSFQFEQQSYVLQVESEVSRDGERRPHLLVWDSAFGDLAQAQDSQYSTTFYFDSQSRSLESNAAGDAEESRIINTGSYDYVGIDDRFFTAAFLPVDSESALRMETSSVNVVPMEGADEELFATLAVGGEARNHFRVYVGPKDIDLLTSVLPQMSEIVDFGFWSFVAEPIFWMLRWTHDHVVANYGWGIIIVTVFINFALFPLKWKSMKSMKKMQALQPLVKQINEKYKGLSMRDPKKAQQNEEMMALYKKHGVNPVGGCLPMLLQLPFFIGFYSVLTVAIELRHASWLWVTDLSAPETLAVRVLPLAMVLTQFWQQSMTPTPSADPAQMRLMKFMPLMFGFIFYGFSSGLVLFWLTSNVVGVAQQALLNRFSSTEEVIEKPKRRGKKKQSAKKGRQ